MPQSEQNEAVAAAGIGFLAGMVMSDEFAADDMLLMESRSLRTAAQANIVAGRTVYRLAGGEARSLGTSWTTVNPANVAAFRDFAGLFPGNTGQFVLEGRLMNTQGVLFRDALPGPSGLGGGAPELLIPRPGTQVCLLCVSGANPPF